MTTGQTIEAKIIVDAKQATAEIDKFNGKLSSVETNIGKAGAALPQLEKSSGMAASKMLILGQAVDDAQYGLRGVVNNMPQVVQAFGGSLGLAGGIGIAAVAISQLSDLYQKYDAIQQEVTANSRLWRGALDDVDKVLREGVNKRTQDLTQALKDAQTELRNFGKTARQITEDEARASVAATEKQLQTLEKNLPSIEQRAKPQGRKNLSALQVLGIEEVFTDQEKEDFKMQAEAFAHAKTRRDELTKSLEEQRKAISDLVEVNKKLSEAEKAKEKKDKESKNYADSAKKEIDAKYEIYVAGLKDEEDQLRDMRKAARKREEDERKQDARSQLKETRDLEREKNKAAKEAAAERKRVAEEEAKAKSDAERQFTQMFIDAGQQAASTALSTAQDYIEAKIKGEKYAEQKAVASFLSATGQQLVGSGTRAIFEGAIISSNPLTPGAGAGMIATGVAAIAAGIGMGAGGAAMSSTIPADKTGSKGAARDRGASPRSSSGSGSGGPLVINVSYGVGGPLPEDTAREIARVMRTGDRRRGAA
jgi:hypothetical protein